MVPKELMDLGAMIPLQKRRLGSVRDVQSWKERSGGLLALDKSDRKLILPAVLRMKANTSWHPVTAIPIRPKWCSLHE
ncbi:hypothetical protein KIN20_030217 [Parelaphostrongylus tenuis]|uniref:Uncharacterized protein n=1 Tax=Parelaphostrongylus tenuis TaxID=148309 RepID=A0AAD5R3Q6_PARTN|nr:hypothetical protein KIN20_030217 [Parelaphostrongylus tenuis]